MATLPAGGSHSGDQYLALPAAASVVANAGPTDTRTAVATHFDSTLADQEYFTTGQVAQLLRVHKMTIARMFDAGEIRGRRIRRGSPRQIPRDEVLRVLEMSWVDPAPPAVSSSEAAAGAVSAPLTRHNTTGSASAVRDTINMRAVGTNLPVDASSDPR